MVVLEAEAGIVAVVGIADMAAVYLGLDNLVLAGSFLLGPVVRDTRYCSFRVDDFQWAMGMGILHRIVEVEIVVGSGIGN